MASKAPHAYTAMRPATNARFWGVGSDSRTGCPDTLQATQAAPIQRIAKAASAPAQGSARRKMRQMPTARAHAASAMQSVYAVTSALRSRPVAHAEAEQPDRERDPERHGRKADEHAHGLHENGLRFPLLAADRRNG